MKLKELFLAVFVSSILLSALFYSQTTPILFKDYQSRFGDCSRQNLAKCNEYTNQLGYDQVGLTVALYSTIVSGLVLAGLVFLGRE